MNLAPCPHAGECGGCAGYEFPSSSFDEAKERVLTQAAQELNLQLPCLAMIRAGDDAFRDRVDLTFSKGKLGFFKKEKSEVFDLVFCRQLSPLLQKCVSEFQTWVKNLKIEKGSVRLRISPQGVKGVWLDFSNADTALFLKETELVSQLLKLAHVEVGQRLKTIIKKDDGSFGLSKERILLPWFTTFGGHELRPFMLNSLVGSFTQTGVKANRVMVAQVLELLHKTPELPIMELFCGLGNFTLPLASSGRPVHAYEVDELSLACLKKTLDENPEVKERVKIHELNLYSNSGLPSFSEESLLFVDPPRSGLKNVLGHILATAKEKRPQFILYVSCFAPSLAFDLSELCKAGYLIEDLRGFDQFPQSTHCEWGVLLKKM